MRLIHSRSFTHHYAYANAYTNFTLILSIVTPKLKAQMKIGLNSSRPSRILGGHV